MRENQDSVNIFYIRKPWNVSLQSCHDSSLSMGLSTKFMEFSTNSKGFRMSRGWHLGSTSTSTTYRLQDLKQVISHLWASVCFSEVDIMAYLAWLPAQLTEPPDHQRVITVSTVSHWPLCPAILNGRALDRASEVHDKGIPFTSNKVWTVLPGVVPLRGGLAILQFDVDRAASWAPSYVEKETM